MHEKIKIKTLFSFSNIRIRKPRNQFHKDSGYFNKYDEIISFLVRVTKTSGDEIRSQKQNLS